MGLGRNLAMVYDDLEEGFSFIKKGVNNLHYYFIVNCQALHIYDAWGMTFEHRSSKFQC